MLLAGRTLMVIAIILAPTVVSLCLLHFVRAEQTAAGTSGTCACMVDATSVVQSCIM